MPKRGKVGCGGREIMAALWGSKGRPETNAYAKLCANRAARSEEVVWTTVHRVEEVEPESANFKEKVVRCTESPRTAAKWAKARKAHEA